MRLAIYLFLQEIRSKQFSAIINVKAIVQHRAKMVPSSVEIYVGGLVNLIVPRKKPNFVSLCVFHQLVIT